METTTVETTYFHHQMQSTCAQLLEAIRMIPDALYAQPLGVYGGSSVGMHFRHVIEFFQSLHAGVATGKVCYESRSRHKLMEESSAYASGIFGELTSTLQLKDMPIAVVHMEGGMPAFEVASTYYRELWYVLEHAIHHMALIKIGYTALDITLPADFGVAPSTIQYREACAL